MATFVSDGRALEVEYMGDGQWHLRPRVAGANARSETTYANDAVVAAMVSALELEAPVPHDTRRIEAHCGRGDAWVRNHTYPAALWTYNTATAMGSGTLHECVWGVLLAFRLTPANRRSAPAPSRFDAFTYRAFVRNGDRVALCASLAELLVDAIEASDEPEAAQRSAIGELRARGHDLYSFDSDGGTFEIWCGDWTKSSARQLRVHMCWGGYQRPGVDVRWVEQ
jgi:hypothetical protein